MAEFSIISDSMPNPPFLDAAAGNFAEKSFLFATLHAIRLHFYKLLGIQIELSFSDYIKQQWKINNMVTYPRSYVSLTSFEVMRDRTNGRSMRTGGIAAKKAELNNATGNYLKSAKVFPVKIGLELHHFDSDMNRAIFMVENLATISAMGGFSFSVAIQDRFEYQAKVTFEDSISLPIVELSNDSDPGSIELTLPFSVETYVGKIEDIARAFVLTGSNERESANISVSNK